MAEKDLIRAVIVDDELPARENLRFMLAESCPEVEVVGTADGVINAARLFRAENPDLIFLDIRMPSGSEGFDLLAELEGHDFYVVFVTAFKDHAIRAFENRALHYILKPIDEKDLRETVSRIESLKERHKASADEKNDYHRQLEGVKGEVDEKSDPHRIAIHHSRGIKLVEPAEITFVESRGNTSVLNFRSAEPYLDTRTLKIYEALLPHYFYRVHRSYIANTLEIAEIVSSDGNRIVLKNGKELPVSRERKKGFLEKMNL